MDIRRLCVNTAQVNDRNISPTSYSKVQPTGSRTEGKGIGTERAGHEDEGRNAAVGSVLSLRGVNRDRLCKPPPSPSGWTKGANSPPVPELSYLSRVQVCLRTSTPRPSRSGHLDTPSAAGEASGQWAAPGAHAWLHHNEDNAPKLDLGQVKPHSKWQACICGGG